MFHIVLADQEKTFKKKMQQLLRKNGYHVLQVSGGRDLLHVMENEYIDAIMIGTQLEQGDTLETISQFRESKSDIPIIFADKSYDLGRLKLAYQAGVDEYLVKTAPEDEVICRLSALLRRSRRAYDGRLKVGSIVLDSASLSVETETGVMTLPRKEFELLYKLLSYPGTIITRSQLMDEIWGLNTETAQSTLNVHINRLRKRFSDCTEFRLKAVRGIGYKAELLKKESQ